MKIGKIILVEYNQFKVRLFQTTRNATASIEGAVYYFGNIGSYLKTYNSLGDTIVCEVVAIFENDNSLSKPQPSQFSIENSRILLIKPIGTLSPNK